MKRRLSLSIGPLLLVAALATACGGRPGVASAAQPSTPTSPGTSARTVILAENGQTITLRTGDRFLLNLGEDYDWTVESGDETILSRVVNVLDGRGSQGLYEARRAGRTTLTAKGDPVCRKAQPACALPSRTFRIGVVVRG
jgi:hypothetical protein